MGDRTLPAPDDVPDLNQTPKAIEGMGGGVAEPPISLSESQKASLEEGGEMFELYGLVYAAAGVAMAPATEGGSMAITLLGIAMQGVGWGMGQLAEDPPKPFERIVRTPRRVVAPTALTTKGLESLGIAVQRSMFAQITGQCLLDALERLGGAAAAGDTDWTLTHAGVAIQAYEGLVVDLAVIAAAQLAASRALASTPADVMVKGKVGAVSGWIKTAKVRSTLTKELRLCGLGKGEIDAAMAWLESDPVAQGPAARLSVLLARHARQLHRYATSLTSKGVAK